MIPTIAEPIPADPITERAAGYRICVQCVMDTSDEFIEFDSQGICSHCKRYESIRRRYLRDDPAGHEELQRTIDEIKTAGLDKEYDCIVGVSGGVDSTFVAYQTKKLGLRPLAVHMDNGWDSELAVNNIERVLNHLGIDLYTHVLEWEEFRDLQLAFLKASVPDGEIPTDHAVAAVVYQTAVERDIPYIISGSNVVTEAILPASFTYGIWDWRYIRGVHRRFGTRPLRRFPHYDLGRLFYYHSVKRVRSLRILNHMPYVKAEAMRILQDELGWRYYGGKHYESIYTRFFQGYILPRKFNMDKRRPHLSTLICSRQITREQALADLELNPYTEEMQLQDREYVIKKFEITEGEFESIMTLPRRTHHDYPNSEKILETMRGAIRLAKTLHILPHNLDAPL